MFVVCIRIGPCEHDEDAVGLSDGVLEHRDRRRLRRAKPRTKPAEQDRRHSSDANGVAAIQDRRERLQRTSSSRWTPGLDRRRARRGAGAAPSESGRIRLSVLAAAGALAGRGFRARRGLQERRLSRWRTFNWFVASKLLLRDPLDFSVFAPWRLKSDRARLWRRRQTDIACGGQPPLKDKFQCTFQMTLLGNAVLSRLSESGRYAIIPFPGPRRGGNDIIEVYPRATLLGRRHARLRRRRRVRRSLHRHSLPRG